MSTTTSPSMPVDAPTLSTVFITPQMALEMLNKNKQNRNVSEVAVKTMIRDIKNDRWALNGEAIKIAHDGVILDGQHRLLAIVGAGKGIWTVLITGLDHNTQSTMDGGRRRTSGDHFKIQKYTNATNLAAVLRNSWVWEQGDRRLSAHIKPTQRELEDFLDKHPETLRSVEIGLRTYHSFRFLTATSVGVAHYIISQVATDADWAEFFARIADGAGLQTGNPILTMRNRAMSDRDARVHLRPAHQVGYVVYTWNRLQTYEEIMVDGEVVQSNPLYKFGYKIEDGIPVPKLPRAAQPSL